MPTPIEIAVQALRQIQDNHRFNIAAIPAHEVHAICFTALQNLDPGAIEEGHDAGRTNGLYCAVCGEPQIETTSGATCSNGHGGAEGISKPNQAISKDDESAFRKSLQRALNPKTATERARPDWK